MRHESRLYHFAGTTLVLFILIAVAFTPASAQSMPQEYREALTYLGRTGDYKENVLKVNLPRNDLSVSVAGIALPTPFGFGGWIAMTKGDGGQEVMMGDLVLLQDEVNPVLSALLDHGIEVTALHNHFFWDDPRLYFMHVHAAGSASGLAGEVKPALDLIGRSSPHAMQEPGTRKPEEINDRSGTLDVRKLAEIVGHAGDKSGTVYKIVIGRDDIRLTEMGATINARMGLNTWAAFAGSDENAAIAGDFAMLESEVTPVVRALRSHGLNIVAIHHHMTGTRPMVIFLHYWGTGPAAHLAEGFRAGLDVLGKPAPMGSMTR